MEELDYFIKNGKVSLKVFPGSKARSKIYLNNLLSKMKSINDICKDVIDIGLRCRNNNIGIIFIWSIAFSSKVNIASIQQLNGRLFDKCRRNGFNIVDNGAVSEIDLWTDGIHMVESGKGIVANNLINSLNYCLEFVMNPVSWYF